MGVTFLFMCLFSTAAAASPSDWTKRLIAANAQALYARLGLRVVSTSPAAIVLGGAQVRRMAAPLLAC
jgi:hypothetical protein